MERSTSATVHHRHQGHFYNERFELPVMRAEELNFAPHYHARGPDFNKVEDSTQFQTALNKSCVKWERYLNDYEQLSKPHRSSSAKNGHREPVRVNNGQPAQQSHTAASQPAAHTSRQHSPSRDGTSHRQRRPEEEAGFRVAVEKRREAEARITEHEGREEAMHLEMEYLREQVAAFEQIVQGGHEEEVAWQRTMQQLKFSANAQADKYLENLHGENMNESVRSGLVTEKIIESMSFWSKQRRDKMNSARVGLDHQELTELVPLKWADRIQDTIKAVVGPFCASLDKFIEAEGERWEEQKQLRANRARILCRTAYRLERHVATRLLRSWQLNLMGYFARASRFQNQAATRAGNVDKAVFGMSNMR